MDRLIVQTSWGAFGVVGRIHAGPRRPALLVVNGAFPRQTQNHHLVDHFQGANVLVVHLPGMAGVPWSHPTLEEMTEGLQDIARRLLGEVPMVVFGSSAGNLPALGLKLPNICSRLAQEPFFQTGRLWPFVSDSRTRIAKTAHRADVTRYLWEIFGIGPDRWENRDYRHLLANITQPTDVVVGGEALEPMRKLDFWPSFVSADDRAALHAHPLVTLHIGPPGTGHVFGSEAPGDEVVKTLLHAALHKAARLCS